MACEFPKRCGRLDCELLYSYTLLHFTSSTHVCIATANLSVRAGLRSAGRGRDLAVLRTATELGRLSFHIAAPVIWNGLPDTIRDAILTCNQELT